MAPDDDAAREWALNFLISLGRGAARRIRVRKRSDMIVAWEAVGLVPKIEEGTEIKVRLVKLENSQDALGRNIVGIISHPDGVDQPLVDELRRRIYGVVGSVCLSE